MNKIDNRQLFMFAIISAIITANAYYVHPIIGRVAEDFEVSATLVGMVPAFNQIALAIGIFFLLPLGDRISNRKLTMFSAFGQACSITLMAFAEDYALFVLGSTVLGFLTIGPYVLPAYVSKRVDPKNLGHATAVLTTGIIGGILLARAGSGFLGETIGWRNTYMIASGLMFSVTLVLPFLMEEREQSSASGSYLKLIGSLFPMLKQHPHILISGLIQAMSFGIFLAVWMGLGLYLTSDEMGYGTDTVGYLAAFSIFNLATTPKLGAWADKVGAYRARLTMASVQLIGVTALFFMSDTLWLLCVPILVMTLVGPVLDITGRMTFLNLDNEIRTRMMTVYIVFMFTGGGICSWSATAIYDYFGWTGNVILSTGLSLTVFALSFFAYRRHKA